MTSDSANILLVDDHLNSLQALSLLLTRQGYRIRKATSGAIALQTIRVELPDLILLDIQMPQMDGYEVCTTLKADPLTCDIPVIFLTALDDVADKVAAFSAGGVDYITKPFQASEVLARVQNQLMIQQQRRQLLEQNQRLQQEIQERQRLESALIQANSDLQRLALVDSLTQVANRRCFDEHLNHEWQRLLREQAPLSLILCDVDYFKLFNDHYGHLAGDACLYHVAQTINRVIRRPADEVARYGGEEFVIILPNTDVAGAVFVAEQIQAAIAQLAIPHAKSLVNPCVTLSLGITSLTPTADKLTQDLIAAADTALYTAKCQGRDRWRVQCDPAPSQNDPKPCFKRSHISV
ncbi:diguanylate cyclase domain-containing protein [Phormidesmis sp. 146-35]